ncbi:unnamed protein product, partial [Adineta steineri]
LVANDLFKSNKLRVTNRVQLISILSKKQKNYFIYRNELFENYLDLWKNH